VVLVTDDDEPPKFPVSPWTMSGVSGFMLSINLSTGMVGGAEAGVLAAVLASGVFMGMPELGGRNFVGYFSAGKGSAA
jgi:hypothetical protein